MLLNVVFTDFSTIVFERNFSITKWDSRVTGFSIVSRTMKLAKGIDAFSVSLLVMSLYIFVRCHMIYFTASLTWPLTHHRIQQGDMTKGETQLPWQNRVTEYTHIDKEL